MVPTAQPGLEPAYTQQDSKRVHKNLAALFTDNQIGKILIDFRIIGCFNNSDTSLKALLY